MFTALITAIYDRPGVAYALRKVTKTDLPTIVDMMQREEVHNLTQAQAKRLQRLVHRNQYGQIKLWKCRGFRPVMGGSTNV